MGKTKAFKYIGLISVWAFATISLLSTTANAITGGGISVVPLATSEYPERRSWFIYEAEPKTVIKDKVEISNLDSKETTINIAALDGAVTNDGGYTLVGGADQNKDVGNWVKLDKSEVTLPPKTKITVGFTLTVPDNADVGSHAGGIVVWAAKPNDTTNKQSGQLQVVTTVAARLYLTVPGDIVRKLDISNLGHYIHKGVLYFKMTLHNSGNVTLLPEADIKLQGIFGRAGQQGKSQLGTLLRGTTINAKFPWQKKTPKFGRFVADMRLHYGEKDFKGEYIKDEYQDVKYVFWLIPWAELLWIFVALMLILFIRKFWVWILIKQRLNTKTKSHTVKKGETLSVIANLYQVDAKKITRFNLLKWPYDLMAGDVLLIPQGRMTPEERQYQKEHPELQVRRPVPSLRHPGPTGRRPSSDSGSLSQIPGQARNDGSESGLEPVIMEEGDTVKTVAEFAGVSPKEIIKLNRLKWPYKLRAGQELFIPAIGLEDEISDKAKTKSVVIKKSSNANRLSTPKKKPKR